MNKNNYSRPFLDKLEQIILTGGSPHGIYQETLEYLDGYDDEMSKLKQQRDELLAALKDTVEIIYGLHSDPEVLNAYKVHYDNDDILRAETAIKNAEGK